MCGDLTNRLESWDLISSSACNITKRWSLNSSQKLLRNSPGSEHVCVFFFIFKVGTPYWGDSIHYWLMGLNLTRVNAHEKFQEHCTLQGSDPLWFMEPTSQTRFYQVISRIFPPGSFRSGCWRGGSSWLCCWHRNTTSLYKSIQVVQVSYTC